MKEIKELQNQKIYVLDYPVTLGRNKHWTDNEEENNQDYIDAIMNSFRDIYEHQRRGERLGEKLGIL